jgi:hypothetical protein
MTAKNTLAYYDAATIRADNSFILQALGCKARNISLDRNPVRGSSLACKY